MKSTPICRGRYPKEHSSGSHPQKMVPNREACGVQTQSGNYQDRLIAVVADPHNWQGSHPSGQSPNDTPESWDNGESGWIPY